MAAIHDLLSQIQDEELRSRIDKEFEKLSKQKKFGLVFEEHLPECTPLYDLPIKKGSKVMLRNSKEDKSLYIVIAIDEDTAICGKKDNIKEQSQFNINEIVRVAEFGEPIYPYLQRIDSVCNAPEDSLWHTLIEADNYHALQLLEYLYAGKVDCIYIDPPYNTGARDWKYNNDYVDSVDSYRHSKWLSMMQKRLRIAKNLLNPKDSVLIVTIDEKEYLHLGCLLEEMFPSAAIQMVSTIINPKGVSSQQGFKRADEYIFFVMQGIATPTPLPLGNEWSPSAIRASSNDDRDKSERTESPGWTSMMRRGSHSARFERPGLYYAIYADPVSHKIVKIGDVLPLEKHEDIQIDGLVQILPIRTNGDEGCWQVGPIELQNRISQGRVRLGKPTDYGFVVNYLPDGEYRKIVDGIFKIEGYEEDGSIIATRNPSSGAEPWVAPTQWKIASHDASAYGSILLSNIVSGKRFAFPKSLYAVHDTLRFFVSNKPEALIIDFFAGSGTTLHAVNLLNSEDGGHRRCIMVTNNEVSDEEAKSLQAQGFKPGDDEWEKLGIARYVTWPRTVCSIEGHDVNGNQLKGNYYGSDIPMANGFKANAAFFKLSFLDKTAVALGMQLRELIPLLWMKAGAIGNCPEIIDEKLPEMLVFPSNKFAILVNEKAFDEFRNKLDDEIRTVFLITDYEVNYRSMANNLGNVSAFQLYRDYLDNFRIYQGRN